MASDKDTPRLTFETLNTDLLGNKMQRAKVPGGWLVSGGYGLTFVPDASHKWDGGSLD